MASSFDIITFNGAGVSYSAGIPYDTRKLQRWNGSNLAPQPSVANNTGYDVATAQFNAHRREGAYHHANGNLCDGTFWWPMFITNVSIDIALAGKTAQSRMTRDFYPHNFTQPSFTIEGQALDQRDYGSLTDFVHQAQRGAITHGGSLIQLYVNGNGYSGSRNNRHGVTKNGTLYPNQIIRGNHQAILAQGYVGSMPREHKKSVYAPTYSFQFIVADMIAGPYHEDMVQVVQQQNWLDVVKSTQTLKVNQALLKQNNQNLGWALKNSDNIFNTGQ